MKNILKNPLFYQLLIVVGLLIAGYFTITLFLNRLDNLNFQNEQNQQNIVALTDSVRKTREDNRAVYSKFQMQFGSIKELQQTMPKLFKKIDGLENSESITNITNVTNVYSDTSKRDIPTDVIRNADSTYTLKWQYVSGDSSRILAGETIIDIQGKIIKSNLNGEETTYYSEETLQIEPQGTNITKDMLRLQLLVGTRRNGKYDEIFVVPNNPNVTITDVEGAQIKRKMKRFGIGPYIGGGFGYNPFNNQFETNIQIGVGVTYSIIRF